jgi:Tol biopolymer transport system component
VFWTLYSNRSASINADGVPFLSVPAVGGKPAPPAGREVVVRRDGYFDYSPDGRYLVLSKGSGRFDVQNKRLARVDTRTGRWQWLTPPELAATAPRFSPDGRRVAFVAVADRGGEGKIGERSTRRRIWVMKADGSGRKALTSDSRYADSSPRWLPDGRLLFLREPKDPNGARSGLWTLDARRGKPTLVTEFRNEPLGEPEARFDVLLR